MYPAALRPQRADVDEVQLAVGEERLQPLAELLVDGCSAAAARPQEAVAEQPVERGKAGDGFDGKRRKALDFRTIEPGPWRYCVEGSKADPHRVRVVVTGDLDCDGVASKLAFTWRLATDGDRCLFRMAGRSVRERLGE